MRAPPDTLFELAGQAVTLAAQADLADLTTLGDLHSRLSSMEQSAAAELSEAAAGVAKTVERIILREIDDLDSALQNVRQSVQELLLAVSQGRGAERVSEADDVALLTDFIEEARGHLNAAESNLLALESDPLDRDAIAAVFRSVHCIKAAAGFLNLRQITQLAHADESILDLVRHGRLELSGDGLDVILESVDMMRGLLADVEQASVTGTAPPVVPALEPLLTRLAAYEAQATPLPPAPVSGARAPSTTTPRAGEQTVKVSIERLDRLLKLLNELVDAQSMTARISTDDPTAAEKAERIEDITRGLQALATSMRMVPIRGVFQKLARVARDVARRFDKEIAFSTSGSETEVDRDVVEALSDPLLHMVRNSVDHGIETPAERQRAGKPRAGQLHLRAYHEAWQIVIEITDDGRGLDTARLLKKARAAGIIAEGETLDDQAAFRLIFHAGLSTADKVTDISGRGVGMDIVQQNVEALRGNIEISSAAGRGTTFTIRAPLAAGN